MLEKPFTKKMKIENETFPAGRMEKRLALVKRTANQRRWGTFDKKVGWNSNERSSRWQNGQAGGELFQAARASRSGYEGGGLPSSQWRLRRLRTRELTKRAGGAEGGSVLERERLTSVSGLWVGRRGRAQRSF